MKIDVKEMLASELHRQHRAAEKAMRNAANGRGLLNVLMHDHGWSSCSHRKYFMRRAAEILRRGANTNPATLGEAEMALHAKVLERRLLVGLSND